MAGLSAGWSWLAVRLNWQETEPDEYEVTIVDAAGGLVQRRVLAVSEKAQVDLLEIAPTLAAGVYFLRAASGRRVVTRRIVVL